MYECPQHHQSETPGFCSVCGIEIPGTSAAPPGGPAAPAGDQCPDCGSPREGPAQLFCEVCGYNYRTRTSGVPPAGGKPGTPATARPTGQPTAGPPAVEEAVRAPTPDAPGARWDVVLQVDANLYGRANPDAPVGQPSQTFPLFAGETLIGRAGAGVRVQVPVVNDPGVSRRQALLILRPGGALALRDLGSANGTQLNGVDVVPGVDTPVKDGDAIGVGAWTRITVRSVSS
jgi:FHA domain